MIWVDDECNRCQPNFILRRKCMQRVVQTDNLTYEQWRMLRKNGIGGSDAAAILGVSPFKSVLELWREKRIDALEAQEETEEAYWGKKLESIVRVVFSTRRGLSIYTEGFLLQHTDYPFMQANLDGYLHDSVYGPCVFEAKTASAYKASDWENGVPDEYYAQLQHYMAVTGYKGAYIAALIGGNKFIWKFVERDNDYIENLIRKEDAFWICVLTDKEPAADGSKATSNYLDNRYPTADEKETVLLNQGSQQWIDLYLDAKKREKIAVQEKELAENQLKVLLQNKEKGVLGQTEVIWQEIISERFNTKELKRDEPELYEQYAYKMRYRKFSIKQRKGESNE